MNKTTEFFEISPEQIKLKQVLNQDFLELEIKAISNDYPNRNQSYFSVDSMKKSLHTFYNKPILGFFKNDDFESHNGIWKSDKETEEVYWDTENGERILGLIRESDKINIVEEDNKTWIKLTCVLYVQYVFQQVKKIFKDKKKKVSVEIEVLERHVDEKGIVCIDKFKLMGITVLGSKNGMPIQEGIEGASLSVLNFMEQVIANKQQEALCFAYSQLNDNNANQNNNKIKEETKKVDDKIIFSINKSKEVISFNNWNKNNTYIEELKKSENFSEIATEVFLQLEEGWEEDSSKLKYPVMELKEKELVYNFNALIFAKFHAEIFSNTTILEKLKLIYTSLDLTFEETEKYDLYEEVCSKKEYENQINEISNNLEQTKTTYDEEVEKFNNLNQDYENFKTEQTEKINTLTETHKQELEKYSDYETLKSENEQMTKELFQLNCEKRVSEAKFLMEDSFSEKEIEIVVKKCKDGKYETYEQLKQEVGLMLLEEKTKNKKKDFNVPINKPIETEKKEEKSKSHVDRLKEYTKKNKQ